MIICGLIINKMSEGNQILAINIEKFLKILEHLIFL